MVEEGTFTHVDMEQEPITNNQRWSDIVRDFTEKTTFHGLRYITEDTRYKSRRISWVLIVLAIISVFSYAIISRVLHFYERPVYIDLQVGYMSDVPFPAVTVCNQNPYRLSTLQEHGMYDVMREAYTKQSQNESKDPEFCEEKYMLNPVICTIPNDAVYSYQFVEVTMSSCKDLCTGYAAETCSGFLYELQSRSCTLTSYTGEDKTWYTDDDVTEARIKCADKMAYFYRRFRCVGESDVYCSFEDKGESTNDVATEKCGFEHDSSLSDMWTRRQGSDSTFGSDNGHFLQLFMSDSYTQTVARIQTDYINTTSKCILFAALVDSSEELSIKLVQESLDTTTLLTSKGHSTLDYYWSWMFAKLPSGLHRVVIEGSKADHAGYKMVIDDVTILPCNELRRNCTRNPAGSLFLGDMYTPENGPNCKGGIFDEYFNDYTCEAYGQNPRYLSTCECSAAEFTCDDGFCISKTLTCDRVSDCLDGSDERQDLCGPKKNLSCEFDDVYLCGYHNFGSFSSTWERRYYPSLDDRHGNGYLLQLNTEEGNILPGESALVTTPMEHFPHNTLVTISIKSLLHPEDNGVSVYLYGDSGLSHNPVLIHGLSKVKQQTYSLTETSLIQSVQQQGGRSQYVLCVPGGEGLKQSLIFQAIHTREDNFAIESVNVTGAACNLTDEQEHNVFATQHTLNCSFAGDICDYSVLREHVQMTGVYIPLSQLRHLQQTQAWMNGNAKRFVSYNNKDYNTILFETRGIIECGSGCNDAWLIVSPEDTYIRIDIIFIVPAQSSCVSVFHAGEWLPDNLCRNSSNYISRGNKLEIYGQAINAQFKLKYEFVTPDNQTLDSVLAFVYTGQFIQESYGFQLFSPPMTFTSTSCLTFSYLRRAPLRVIQISADAKQTILFEDTEPSSDDDQFAYMTITVPKSGDEPSIIMFETKKTQSGFPHYFLVLKFVYLYDMSCLDYSLQYTKELQVKGTDISGTCDFDDEDQCGYMDMSWSKFKWVRDRVPDANGELRTVMRYGSSLRLTDDLSRFLLSPVLMFGNNSCMQLTIGANTDATYFWEKSYLNILIKSSKIDTLQQFSVSSSFDKHEVALPVGEYQLIFQPIVRKDGVIIYIDTIEILSPCSEETTATSTSTASDFFHTEAVTTLPETETGQQTTVSPSVMPNENLDNRRRDFSSSVEGPDDNVNIDSATINDKVTEVRDLYMNDEEAKTYVIESLDHMNFSQILSHRTDNFLIRCTWNGRPCDESMISTTETDMGTCLSFNTRLDDHLKVYKPGPLHGLKMILNIEKYEDVENTGTNSGVKIDFYPTDDVPAMGSKGYFVSPGSHVLFNLQYTNSSFLEPAYGTCGRKELSLFSEQAYSHSRCLTQCATDHLWNQCRCHQPYMSGDANSHCKISDYLNCVLPRQSTTEDSCACPDACDMVTYKAQFSTSTFSDEAIASLLSDKEDTVLQNYRKSLNMRERVRTGSFPELFTQIHDMNADNRALRTLLERDSIVGVVAEALTNLTLGAHSDFDAMVVYYEKYLQGNQNCSDCSATEWKLLRDQLRSSNINLVRTSTKHLDDIQNWYALWLNHKAGNMVGMYELAENFTSDQEPFSLYMVSNIVAVLRGHLQQNVIQHMKTNIESNVVDTINFYNKLIGLMEECSCERRHVAWDGYARQLSVLKQPSYDFQEEIQYDKTTELDVLVMLAEFSVAQFGEDLQNFIDHVIRDYSKQLVDELDQYLTHYQHVENVFLTSLEKMTSTMEQHKDESRLDPDFIKDNIIQVDAYFSDLKYTQTEQKVEYGVADFFSDLGGFLGLLLGASVVTVVEVLDLIIYNIFSRNNTMESDKSSSQNDGKRCDTMPTYTTPDTRECLVDMSGCTEGKEGGGKDGTVNKAMLMEEAPSGRSVSEEKSHNVGTSEDEQYERLSPEENCSNMDISQGGEENCINIEEVAISDASISANNEINK